MPKFLLFFFCLCFTGISAQDEKIDSVNAAVLQQYRTLLLVAKKQKSMDSVAKVNLEEKIKGLKLTDNLEKKAVEKQLNTLRLKDSIRIVEKKIAIESRRLAAVGYPVNGFFKDTLFIIYNKTGSFSARERAEAISRRIKKLGGKFTAESDSLKIVRNEFSVDIEDDDEVIISLSEDDALWNDTTKQALAEKYRDIIQQSVKDYESKIDFSILAKEIGITVLILLGVFLLIVLTNKLFRWTAKLLKEWQDLHKKALTVGRHNVLNAEQLTVAFLAINFILKWIVILLIIAFLLPIIFGLFQWTNNFPNTLLGYILTPLKRILVSVWQYLPNLMTILVVIFIFRYALLALKSLKTKIQFGRIKISGFYKEWAGPTYYIIRILAFAFLIVVIFEYLPKSESPIFKGVSVFLGLLFTFGSAGSLSNMTSGLILTYMRLFKIGDRARIGEAVGDVVEKSLLVIRLRTSSNEIISIPNSTVMNSHTINYSSESLEKGLILTAKINISYDVPWDKVHKALLEAADRTEWILKDPESFVLQSKLEDFYVCYEICVYTKRASNQATIYSNLHRNILDTFREDKIDIVTPHYRAERDEIKNTFPAQPEQKTNIDSAHKE